MNHIGAAIPLGKNIFFKLFFLFLKMCLEEKKSQFNLQYERLKNNYYSLHFAAVKLFLC